MTEDHEAVPASESEALPRHVAIIMDGNGRWARNKGLTRAEGHRAGVKALKPIVKYAAKIGIQVLTVYAFSTENWQRPRTEVEALMSLLVEFLRSETLELKDEGVRVRTIGDIAALPPASQDALTWAQTATSGEDRLILNLALNYGARDEIVRAMNRWLDSRPSGSSLPITEKDINDHLDTGDLPDPDLLIRSSGELRLSNFLLWQCAYAELYVTNTLWPDFTPEEFRLALDDFGQRQRRFGRIG